MSLYPAPDRRKTPRIAGMVVTHADATSVSPIPPEAGNVHLSGSDASADDTWWPLTWAEVANFWAVFVGCTLFVLTMLSLAAGYSCGMSTTDIVRALLIWGLA